MKNYLSRIVKNQAISILSVQVIGMQSISAWGIRGHTLANLAAVEAIPANGPAFLKAQRKNPSKKKKPVKKKPVSLNCAIYSETSPRPAPLSQRMPRRSRCVLPGMPCHITQRGVDRRETFSSDQDRTTYLRLLQANLQDAQASLLGWCLMTNHVHLIAVPEPEDSLAVLLRRVHGRYAQYYNARSGRTGHLWQNRFFACLLERNHLWNGVGICGAESIAGWNGARRVGLPLVECRGTPIRYGCGRNLGYGMVAA